MVNAPYGGYGSAEAQSKALSDAMNLSMTQNPDQWKKYVAKPWVQQYSKPTLSDRQLSQKLLAEKKMDDARLELDKIEKTLESIQSKKDDLKLRESMHTGNHKSTIQLKVASNQIYRDLTSQETDLENKRRVLESTIKSYQTKMNQIDITSEAGRIFSSGLNMTPVMDFESTQKIPIANGAITPEERAISVGKQNTLIDPNFGLQDVAGKVVQGFIDQGLDIQAIGNFAGGNYKEKSTMNNAINSMIKGDFETAGKTITSNPEKFVGNMAFEAVSFFTPYSAITKGAKVGGAVSKIISNTAKIEKYTNPINEAEKTVMQAEMGKLPPIPKNVQQKVDKEISDMDKKYGLDTGAVKSTRLERQKKNTPEEINAMLGKVKEDTGYDVFFGYSKENIKKYTGVGIGVGTLGMSKPKKHNNVFNFKY